MTASQVSTAWSIGTGRGKFKPGLLLLGPHLLVAALAARKDGLVIHELEPRVPGHVSGVTLDALPVPEGKDHPDGRRSG